MSKSTGDICMRCKKHRSKCICAKTGKGAKFSEGKLDWTLLPIEGLEGTVKVLKFGLKKYARNNWKKVPDGKHEYLKAMFRHIVAMKKGEQIDPDSGLHHWHHMMCDVLFVCWFLMKEKEEGKGEHITL